MLKKHISSSVGIIIILIVIQIVGLIGYLVLGGFNFSNFSASNQAVSKTKSKITLIALGDSISRAANLADDKIGDNPAYSFACGSQIRSLAKYLKSKYKVTCKNLSVSGATSATLLSNQAPQVKSKKPKFITLEIGGNDLALGVTTSQFEINLTAIIKILKKTKAKIYLSTIYDLGKMREADYPVCKKRNLSGAYKDYSPLIAKLPLRDYNQLISGVISYYNKVIEKVAINQKVILVDIYPYLNKDHISPYDCYHPSLAGQGKIAELFANKMPK